jgi:hypothetical protein
MSTSSTEVKKALKGADYPASREDLIEVARENEAPDDVIDELEESLGEEEYDSPADVMAVLGGED